ncbi:MFS transporter [Streptomyces sp. NPDC006923]|uniref:MFS transporter n=1 Tax=Streptomyces sp. NPDC006923 TaxID=3155355 RepID=UPI0033ED0855
MSLAPSPPPAAPRPDRASPSEAGGSRNRWLSLAVACLGMMMTFFNITATISVLALIQADLHVSTSSLIWVSSAYTLLVASLVLSAGTFGDVFGRRKVFLIGIVLIGAGSLLAFLSGSLGVLITAQAVMGIGGALVLPNSLSLVTGAFSDPHERTEAVSIWAGCSGIGLAVAPLLAGVLLLHFSWHSVYLLNVGIALVAAVLTPVLVAESRHPDRALDPVGLILGTVTIGLLTFAVIESGGAGYTDARVVGAFAGFLVALGMFLWFEARHHDPMLDLRLFRSASFSAVMAVAAGVMFAFTGVALLLVLYFEKVRALSALDTGWRLLPLFVSYIAVSSVAGRIVRRTGFRTTLTGGLLIAGAGVLLLLIEGPDSSYHAIWPGMTVLGLGSGLLIAPSTAAAMISVPHTQTGMASGAVNMFRQLGSVLGTSILGTILTTRMDTNLADRLRDARVPGPVADTVREAASDGTPAGTLPPDLAARVTKAVAHAFTDAQHTGFLVAALLLFATAVPTVLFVRKRQAAAPPAPGGGAVPPAGTAPAARHSRH